MIICYRKMSVCGSGIDRCISNIKLNIFLGDELTDNAC